MTNFGIIGRGFIGNMHLAALAKNPRVNIAAVADEDETRLKGEGGTAGNIAIEGDLNLDGVALYTSADDLINDPNVEAVLIALPTFLHKEHILKAVKAGKHILCEKPMTPSVAEGEEIVDIIRDYDGVFMVGHCIRLWPAYAKAAEIVREGTYGKVRYAQFTRESAKPTWSAKNWILDQTLSGGSLLDLHIHDVDFVNYVFGKPASMHAAGVKDENEGIGQVVATYMYDDGKVVSIEGGWIHPSTYPFRMAFNILCENATLEFNSTHGMELNVYPVEGEPLKPELPPEDGYIAEHNYFLDCIEQGKKPEIITAESSLEAIALVEEELRIIG